MNVSRLKEFFRYAIVPIVLLIIFALAIPIYRLLGLPGGEELIAITKDFYLQYGYWVVLIGAVIEGALFINWYLPGSAVVVLGVVFARDASLNVFLVVALIIFGFLVTAVLNYALGRFGWHRLFMKLGLKAPLEKIQHRTERYGLSVVFSTYFHPNMGALTATSAGILKLSFNKFFLYSLGALVFWNALWGVVVYFFGDLVIKAASLWVLLGLSALWVIFLGIKFARGKNEPAGTIP